MSVEVAALSCDVVSSNKMLSWILGGEGGENKAGKLAMGFGATGLGIAVAAAPTSEMAAAIITNLEGGAPDFMGGRVVLMTDEAEDFGFVGSPNAPSTKTFSLRPPCSKPSLYACPWLQDSESPPVVDMGSGKFESSVRLPGARPSQSVAVFDRSQVFKGFRELIASLKPSQRSRLCGGILSVLAKPSQKDLTSDLATQLAHVFELGRNVAGDKIRGAGRNSSVDCWASKFADLARSDRVGEAGRILGAALTRLGDYTRYYHECSATRDELAEFPDFVFKCAKTAAVAPEEKFTLRHFDCEIPLDHKLNQKRIDKMSGLLEKVITKNPDALTSTLVNVCILNNPFIQLAQIGLKGKAGEL